MINSKFDLFSVIVEEYDELNNKHITKDMLKTFLDSNSDTFNYYAFILHDRDINPNGEVKHSHYHIVLSTYHKYAKSSIIGWFASDMMLNRNIIQVKGIFQNDAVGYIRYLTHADNEDKESYDDLEVVSSDLSIYYDAINNNVYTKSISVDYILDLVLHKETKTEVYIELGIKNAKEYSYLVESIWKECRL